MSADDATAAFGPPGDRLAAVPPGAGARDRISLTDHVRSVEIGAFESERGVTQRLAFDVAVEVAPVEAGDDVDRILSYDRIAEAIDGALADGRVALLETLAEGVAGRILAEPQALRVLLRIRKLDRGPGALGVEIVRERGGAAGGGTALPPFRVALGAAPALGDGPVLRLPDALPPRPEARGEAARRRVALLALDQAAWLLAEELGATVVASRTEIDWALRRGVAAVLAPSRLVLEAPEAEAPDARDPGAVANWVARRLGAA